MFAEHETGVSLQPALIRSHSGGLALPRCNHFLGNPLRGWQSFYIECVTLEDDPCGPLQSFLGAGNDCGISQSLTPTSLAIISWEAVISFGML